MGMSLSEKMGPKISKAHDKTEREEKIENERYRRERGGERE